MFSLVFAVIGLTPVSYEDAYKAYKQEERAIIVVISDKYCEHCGPYKKKLYKILEEGNYKANLVELDADKDIKLIHKVWPKGGGLPATILFNKIDDKFKKTELIGNNPEFMIDKFLEDVKKEE